jgi:hypothetical protein
MTRDNTQKSFTRYGWYAVLGILAVIAGVALGLAAG